MTNNSVREAFEKQEALINYMIGGVKSMLKDANAFPVNLANDGCVGMIPVFEKYEDALEFVEGREGGVLEIEMDNTKQPQLQEE